MTFVSYAQNFEDVMLWRCFGHLRNGFYVDIGAWDPIVDSVTKSFYDNGWTGLNIEPNKNAFLKIQSERPLDTNIQIAIGETSGSMDFWFLPSASGMSTGNKNYADQHKEAGFEVNLMSVEVRTLKEVCEEFVTSPIHFMKIDVEGLEKQVLKSADFDVFRPMVLVIESNEPMSTVENFIQWEYILTDNNYQFCYADGLNRFYLANEASDLFVHFKYPPNVFDNFILRTDSRMG